MVATVKNRESVILQVLIYSSCLAAFPVTCHSIFAKSKTGPDDGYEYVVVTGSVVPQRVKKGQAPVTASPVGVMGVPEFEKLQQKTTPASGTSANGS